MATIALYESKINNMPSLIKEVKNSVGNLKSELTSFQSKCSKINRNICNLDDVISSISSSTRTQEEKETSLNNFSKNVETFAAEVDKIDSNVADMINESKDDFYDQYYYLKPEGEKNGWEKLCDGCDSFVDWCKDNWEYICACVVAVIVVVGLVLACIAAFPVALVALVVAVGAAVGLASQLISDVISWVRTGEWTGTWKSYIGAAFGGIAGSCVLLLTGGNSVLACTVDSAISTLFSESLEAITGGERRPMGEILLDTAISAGTAAIFGKLFDKLSNVLSKKLASKIPLFKRLSGSHSYGTDFTRVVTRLLNGNAKKFSWKTIRNGIVDGLAGGVVSNIFSGMGGNDLISDGIKWIVGEGEDTPSAISITMPKIEPIPELNILPIRFQLEFGN